MKRPNTLLKVKNTKGLNLPRRLSKEWNLENCRSTNKETIKEHVEVHFRASVGRSWTRGKNTEKRRDTSQCNHPTRIIKSQQGRTRDKTWTVSYDNCLNKKRFNARIKADVRVQ